MGFSWLYLATEENINKSDSTLKFLSVAKVISGKIKISRARTGGLRGLLAISKSNPHEHLTDHGGNRLDFLRFFSIYVLSMLYRSILLACQKLKKICQLLVSLVFLDNFHLYYFYDFPRVGCVTYKPSLGKKFQIFQQVFSVARVKSSVSVRNLQNIEDFPETTNPLVKQCLFYSFFFLFLLFFHMDETTIWYKGDDNSWWRDR